MTELRYDGRVAVVTGAGGGLGRAYALLLGSRGAKVVVNDLGGGRHGDGKSSSLADAVVEEIKNKGGVAVADYNSVIEGEKIIKTALDNFGRIDILINNAGILRDKSFARISDQDWDLIQAVHLKGSFKTTQAAWDLFKKQKYGRVIMTSSNAGVYGNFGQGNYSAAKLGLVGLANTLAVEGAKYNIGVNVIVPTAASRLTEDILPPDLLKEFRPELIAPVVVYLCHESCAENGTIIDSALGFAAKVHIVRSEGTHLRQTINEDVSIESVRDNWSKVVDMSGAKRFNNIGEVTGELVNALQQLKDSNEEYGGKYVVSGTFSYGSKDLSLYALGIGASVTREKDLPFLYENDASFAPFPTFFILPALSSALQSDVLSRSLPPGKVADFSNILHGEQYIEFFNDLPQTEGEIITKSYVEEVLDKGSSAVAIITSDSYDANKNLLFRNQLSTFLVGQGGFNGPRQSDKAVPTVPAPNRKPDAVIEQKTFHDQAALYRLSGDTNPLHIDPNMATSFGYSRPILHGLCSLGFSARHVLMRYGDNNPHNFKALKARFVKPVFPGQTLQTHMWLEGKRVHFLTKVKESDQLVISGAYVDLKTVVPSNATIKPNPTSAVGSDIKLASDAVFHRLQEVLKAQPDRAKAVNGVFFYNILNNGKTVKQWTMDLKSCEIYSGSSKVKVDTTLSLSDDDMVALAAGKLNPQVAFMKGKLKISGNIMLTQKLVPLLETDSKL